MKSSIKRQILKGLRRQSAKQIAHSITESVRNRFKTLDAPIKKIADESLRDLKTLIVTGQITPPNADEYAAWKRRNSKGSVPLVCDGHYLAAMMCKKVADGLYFIGAPPHKIHPTSGLPYWMISGILENGTLDGIPARPHLGPARKRATQRVIALLKTQDDVRPIKKTRRRA